MTTKKLTHEVLWQIDMFLEDGNVWYHWDSLYPLPLDDCLQRIHGWHEEETKAGYTSAPIRLTNLDTGDIIMV